MILFATYILLSNFPVSAGENYPFYFFRLKPTKMKNLLSREEAQKELCKIVSKNCEIPPDSAYDYPPEARAILSKVSTDFEMPSDKKLKYSVQKLYKDPDKKSEIVGAFVNAASGLWYCKNFAEHCYASALASFVINLKGEKKYLKNYVSETPDMIDRKTRNNLASKIGAGEYQSSYYAYMRAMDAIPNDPLSYHAKPTMHWYALANPDESGSKMWFQYKSDLRTPKYALLKSDRNIQSEFHSRIDKIYDVKGMVGKTFMICRTLSNESLSIVLVVSGSFNGYAKEVKKHKIKSFKAFNNGDPVCDSKDSSLSSQETAVKISDFLENGFLKNGFSIFGIEYTDYVEYQESVPVFTTYGTVINKEKVNP